MDRHELVDELWTDAGIVPSSYSAEHPKHYPKEASQQRQEAHTVEKAVGGARKGHPAA